MSQNDPMRQGAFQAGLKKPVILEAIGQVYIGGAIEMTTLSKECERSSKTLKLPKANGINSF